MLTMALPGAPLFTVAMVAMGWSLEKFGDRLATIGPPAESVPPSTHFVGLADSRQHISSARLMQEEMSLTTPVPGRVTLP